MKKKLALYDSYLSEKQESVEQTVPKNTPLTIPFEKKWEMEGVKPYILDDRYCLIKEKRYSLSERRGLYTFKDFLTAVKAWQRVEASHPLSAKGYGAEELFFFDTETTGLGGGVGNTIFLLGYAYLDGDEVVVKQHLLPEPGHEIPLYDSFLRNVNYTTLVTYNGKAFDWPQVKTRHTLIREHVPKLPSFGHFDLLHGARRMWKHRLESVKLANVEREILHIQREGDIPGYLAPMVYFDFLETKNPEGILQVMDHNEQDVLTLISLYTHLSFLLLGLTRQQTGEEKLSAGIWYAQLKETEAAIPLLEKGVEVHEGSDKWRGMFELANQYKKAKNYGKALPLYERIARETTGKLRIMACIEGAKLLEHRFKNYESALILTEKAYQECTLFEDRDEWKKEKACIVTRMRRLEKRMESGQRSHL